ncbi:hypothetical protein TrST_g10964 [Triparma strigata]|uniref:Gamma carbonic anhydrase n=1 Tax=Triparma strigata TaxID=1606541 RepID=A0A9W7C4B9_9STRA|nr:hypothetical protein TrST_g10964 [Triparma strigata]
MSSVSNKFVAKVSNLARSLGASLESLGTSLETSRYTDRLVPSTRFVTFNGQTPSAPLTFVSPASSLIGDVTIGEGSSIWYGSVIRGDVNSIKIGTSTHILSNTVVHVAKIQGDFETAIGSNTIVGASSIIHASTIGDNCLLGTKVQVLDGANVPDNVIIEDGCVVSPGMVLEGGKRYAGVPAKEVGVVGEDDLKEVEKRCEELNALASIHALECGKSHATITRDAEISRDKLIRDPEYFQPDYTGEVRKEEDDVLGGGTPGRIFDNELRSPEGFEEETGWEGNKRVGGGEK